MRHLPVFLDVRQRMCALVGGGTIAARRFEWLHSAGASLRIIAPQLHASLAQHVDGQNVVHFAEPFRPSHLDGCLLAVCATNDATVNAAVARAARERGILANVADHPERGDVIVPAVLERGPVTIAIASSGAGPVFSRWLRARIASSLPATIDRLAQFFAERRDAVKQAIPDPVLRSHFLQTQLDGPLPQLIEDGRSEEAERQFSTALQQLPSHHAAHRPPRR